jgi:hypothetical protein
MQMIRVRAAALIPAPAERVYSILADYHEGHPRILPPKYFADLVVERGGRGEGTVIRFTLRLPGNARAFRASVSEPRPGRVLVESDPEAGAVTTFTVTPVPGEPHARVAIETVARARSGPAGLLERVFAPLLLRSVYEEELRRLAAVASKT